MQTCSTYSISSPPGAAAGAFCPAKMHIVSDKYLRIPKHDNKNVKNAQKDIFLLRRALPQAPFAQQKCTFLVKSGIWGSVAGSDSVRTRDRPVNPATTTVYGRLLRDRLARTRDPTASDPATSRRETDLATCAARDPTASLRGWAGASGEQNGDI